MKTPTRKTLRLLVAALLAVSATWLCLYVLSGPREAMEFKSPGLLGLHQEWLRDGSPEPPPIKKYTAQWTEPDRFFVWTNTYTIDGETFQSLFGMNDPQFEGKGILVISKKGELIWVGSAKSPKVIKLTY